MQTTLWKTLVLAVLCVLTAQSTQAQRLIWLGTVLDDQTFASSEVLDVSNDGVVVGHCNDRVDLSGKVRAFVWDPVAGMRPIPLVSGAFENSAPGITSDSRWIVGWQSVGLQIHAYRWRTEDLNNSTRVGTSNSSQAKCSDDTGNIVVGYSLSLGNYLPAGFVWNISLPSQQLLPPISQGTGSIVLAINGHGTLAVGSSTVSGYPVATLWNIDNHTPTSLGGRRSIAYSLSDDGTTIVGTNNFTEGRPQACRWGNSFGPITLHSDPNDSGSAYDVSADGQLIVGQVNNNAFIWSQTEGMVNLNLRYASLLGGSTLHRANAISKNGRYIVGYGHNAQTRRIEGFILDRGPACTSHNGDVHENGCVDDADLLAVLFAFGQSGNNLGRVDVNCDGTVDDGDLLTVLFNFGTGC